VPGEMIDGFAAVGEVQADGVSNDEAGDRVERALELFKRHFLDLGS
jgi:hypothetical protein